VVADQLNPLFGLLGQVPVHQAKHTSAVRAAIDEITDLHDDHVVGQHELCTTRSDVRQSLPQLVRVSANVANDNHPGHAASSLTSACSERTRAQPGGAEQDRRGVVAIADEKKDAPWVAGEPRGTRQMSVWNCS
jgi:hypothetical protein